jgi:SAM-dependent methyltransferase
MTEDPINYALHYNKWHNASDEHFNSYVPYYSRMLSKHLGADKSLNILDVGCGMGLALYALQKTGYSHVMGIDISKEQIAVAKNKGLNAELTTDTISWLGNKAEQYDYIIALDVIEHIPVHEQLAFTKAIQAALKKGGKFICTVPNANSVLAGRWRYIDWTHTSSFTEHSLEFLLINSNFKHVTVMPVEFFTRPKYPFVIRKSVLEWLRLSLFRWFRRMTVVAELGAEGKKIPLSLNLLAVATK